MLMQSSKFDDVAVRVCIHVCRCYAVSAQFEECRQKFLNDLSIIRDVCRMLYFKVSTCLVINFKRKTFPKDEVLILC